MKSTNKKRLVMAAIAGITLGTSTQGTLRAQDLKDGEVKCYGVNSCGAHAKCSVSGEDIAAVRKLLGEKEFKHRFGKSVSHSCGAHAKCGTAAKILNWVPATADGCKEQGGIRIEETEGKRVAKK